MTDLSSWTAYFQDFGQFFNGFLFTLALAIGSFILAMVLGIFFGAMSNAHSCAFWLVSLSNFTKTPPSWYSLLLFFMVCLLSVNTPS